MLAQWLYCRKQKKGSWERKGEARFQGATAWGAGVIGSHSGFWGGASDRKQIWHSLSEERSKPVMELPWSPAQSSRPHNPPAHAPAHLQVLNRTWWARVLRKQARQVIQAVEETAEQRAAASSFLSYDNSQGETLLLGDPLNLLVELLIGKHQLGLSTRTTNPPVTGRY